MAHKIKISRRFIAIDDQRVGVRYSTGPWIPGVPQDMIKVRPSKGSFPASFRKVFAVTNNSDMREDYFECDQIKVTKDHPLYAQIHAASA